MKSILFSFLLTPTAALACPGANCEGCDKGAMAAVAEKGDASACAKSASLLGSACRYSTGMMAQRVLAEGKDWTYVGTMAKTDNQLSSHVAAPFTFGPDDKVHVVANELLEHLTEEGLAEKRLNMAGKVLELDGLRYFVLTDYTAADQS